MNLEIRENLEESVLNEALRSLPAGAELLQSNIWQQIIKTEGKTSRCLAWLDQDRLVAYAQIIETKKFIFKTWYIPRGPICFLPEQASSLWPSVLAVLKEKARQSGVMSVQLEPINWGLAKKLLGKKIKAVQPEQTLFLYLSLSAEELLAQMHAKTRYNIRLAQKKGVEISQGRLADLKDFWQLLQATTTRDSFRGHNFQHYENLLTQSKGVIELHLAKRQGKVLAAGLFSFYEGQAVYLHGASSNEDRQYMAPHLLQWQMIRRAQEKNCRFYDFYGIDEKKWPGVTRFKLGFGGERRQYAGSFNLVLAPIRFYLYKILSYCLSLFRH